MKKNTDISARITQFIDFMNSNPNDFAKKLGYKRSQTIYDIINNKVNPSFDFFNRLYSTEYSEIINSKWLLTGKGKMLKSDSNSKEEIEDNAILDKNIVYALDYKEKYYTLLEENRDLRLRIERTEKELVILKEKHKKELGQFQKIKKKSHHVIDVSVQE